MFFDTFKAVDGIVGLVLQEAGSGGNGTYMNVSGVPESIQDKD